MTLACGLASCTGTEPADDSEGPGSVVEEPADTSEREEADADSIEASDSADEVSPEYDADGNPTGEYARYLWEQQQKEEAMNSLVEDAMREQYEEDYESHVFPLD